MQASMDKPGYFSAYRNSVRATLLRALRGAEQVGLLDRSVAAIWHSGSVLTNIQAGWCIRE
jgi:hypothetical protein